MIYVIQSKQGLQGIAKKFPQVLSLNVCLQAQSFSNIISPSMRSHLKGYELGGLKAPWKQ